MTKRSFHYFNTKNKSKMETTKTPTLTVATSKRKVGKFTYEIKDSNGNVLATRNSDRMYVAASLPPTNFFFGRLDLVGKGDHKKHIAACKEKGIAPTQIAYLDAAGVKMFEDLDAQD